MAKTCCVCDSKIGAFDKPKQLIDGNDEYVLCNECGEKMNDARATNIAPDNKTALSYHNRAIDHFANYLANAELEDIVVAALMELPDIAERQRAHAEASATKAENERRYREEKDSVIATTGYEVAGYEIVAYHGVVSTDNIIGTGFASELKASVSDIMGESSNALKEKLHSAKTMAYNQLLKDAVYAGGNAIIGVSYNVYVVGSMLGVSVTGTSVTIAKNASTEFVSVPVKGVANC